MFHMVWIELRRSVLAFGAIVLVIGQVALMRVNIAGWRASWPEGSAAVGAPWLFLGAAAAGLSAFDALRRQSSPRPGAADTSVWRSEPLAMLLARVGMVAAAIVAGTGYVLIENLANGTPDGGPWWSYLIVAMSFAIEAVAFGFLVGTFGGPLWFAPLAAALAIFLRAAWFQGAPMAAPEAAFSRVFLSGHPWVHLDAVAVASSVVEALVAVTLALAAPRLLTRLKHRRVGRVYPGGMRAILGAGVASAVVMLGIGIVLASPPMVEPRDPAESPSCAGAQPELCVWPEDAAILPELARVAARASDIATNVGGSLPARYDEYGLEGEGNFVPTGPGTWPFSGDLGMAIAYSLAPNECEAPQSDPSVDDYYNSLWELGTLFQLQIENAERPTSYGDSTGVDLDSVTDVWQLDGAQQRVWIEERTAQMRRIALEWCE